MAPQKKVRGSNRDVWYLGGFT